MTQLLVLKEQLKKIYSAYEIYIRSFSKFFLTFITLQIINGQLGYMDKLDNIALVLMISLVCAVLPTNFIIFVAAAFVVGHVYALSLECTIVIVAIFMIMFLLYFRFSPKDTLVVLLAPISFALNIPYVMPLSMGLVGTPASAISVGCGTVVYYVISYIKTNAPALNTMEAEDAVSKFKYIVDGVMNNQVMFVTVVAFAITVLVVYFIRRMNIDYSWSIAIAAGSVVNIIVLLVGDFQFDTNISIGAAIVGSVVAAALASVLQFFFFNVDYSRTEFVQFEDDEYYYYVKAVPKNIISTPKKRVTKINSGTKEAFTRENFRDRMHGGGAQSSPQSMATRGPGNGRQPQAGSPVNSRQQQISSTRQPQSTAAKPQVSAGTRAQQPAGGAQSKPQVTGDNRTPKYGNTTVGGNSKGNTGGVNRTTTTGTSGRSTGNNTPK